MPARIIRGRDLVRVPWKNGGGTTAEIAVHPPGSAFETFDWRLSMADVATDGPFSTFPGIDRTLVLIEGQAVDLVVDGSAHRLDPARPIVSFTGEAATSARLPAGAIRDFNIMTRRGRAEHEVILVPPGTYEGASAMLALAGPTHLRWDDRLCVLERFDGLLIDPPAACVTTDRSMILVRLRPAAPLV